MKHFDGLDSAKHRPTKIGGELAYYRLEDWWLSALTNAERRAIKEAYGPRLTRGTYLGSFSGPDEPVSAAEFLATMASSFEGPDGISLAVKMADKARSLLDCQSEVVTALGRHFAYSHIIHIYYITRREPGHLEVLLDACSKQIAMAPDAAKARTRHPEFKMIGHAGFALMATAAERHLEATMAACKKSQVSLAPEVVAGIWLAECERRHLPLPGRPRFDDLATAPERQKDYRDAIRLSEEARQQGWQGDWDERILRCQSKLQGKNDTVVNERVVRSVANRGDGPFLRRDTPAFSGFGPDPEYAENPHILRWWSDEQDRVLRGLIDEFQWCWEWEISEAIEKVTPTSVISKWRKSDPVCLHYAWYNVLMNFGSARARAEGWTTAIRTAVVKKCLLCGEKFREDSVHPSLIKRLGFDGIDFCPPCLSECTLAFNEDVTDQQMLQYIRDLVAVLGWVPPQSFAEEGLPDLTGVATGERVALLRVMRRRPAMAAVKRVYGTWLNALIQAGVLEDGTRRTVRGVQTLAKDGHICFSLGEKTIDDLLFAHGIAHDREPPYPEGNYRADFLVGNTFIEFFGLAGDSSYDAKTAKKKTICRGHGIALIVVTPKDLTSQERLAAVIRKARQAAG
ncbi:MAG: hypothetical protein JXA57_11250 [Armatimonadetes bacterium]|nr:hypothetical protein [Armatimonadota bacterium]